MREGQRGGGGGGGGGEERGKERERKEEEGRKEGGEGDGRGGGEEGGRGRTGKDGRLSEVIMILKQGDIQKQREEWVEGGVSGRGREEWRED